jgi:ABC-2 type transport system permease protein
MKVQENLRIIWAIVAKDVVDALRNRTFIAIIIGVAVLIPSGQALPLLLKLSNTPRAVLYDAAKSSLAVELKKSENLRLAAVRSPEEMEQAIGEAAVEELGLIFPPDLDDRLAAGDPIELDGYLAHWVRDSEADELVTFFQQTLTNLAGQPIQIRTEGHTVYAAPDAGGRPFMTSLSLIVVILAICGTVVPYLMIEEKETHTIDALLISPASIGQMVAGKALVGIFYGMVAAGIVYALNLRLVVHWEVAILAAVCGSAFAVSFGLLLGILFDNPQNMNPWFAVGLLVLMMPLFMTSLMASDSPSIVRSVLSWLPSTLLYKAFVISFAGEIPWAETLANLGLVSAYTALLLALTIRRMKRLDR